MISPAVVPMAVAFSLSLPPDGTRTGSVRTEKEVVQVFCNRGGKPGPALVPKLRHRPRSKPNLVFGAGLGQDTHGSGLARVRVKIRWNGRHNEGLG